MVSQKLHRQSEPSCGFESGETLWFSGEKSLFAAPPSMSTDVSDKREEQFKKFSDSIDCQS